MAIQVSTGYIPLIGDKDIVKLNWLPGSSPLPDGFPDQLPATVVIQQHERDYEVSNNLQHAAWLVPSNYTEGFCLIVGSESYQLFHQSQGIIADLVLRNYPTYTLINVTFLGIPFPKDEK